MVRIQSLMQVDSKLAFFSFAPQESRAFDGLRWFYAFLSTLLHHGTNLGEPFVIPCCRWIFSFAARKHCFYISLFSTTIMWRLEYRLISKCMLHCGDLSILLVERHEIQEALLVLVWCPWYFSVYLFICLTPTDISWISQKFRGVKLAAATL